MSHRLRLPALRIAKAMGLFHLSLWIFRRNLLILAYHGFEVHDESRFRPKLFLRPSTFRARLELVRRSGCPVLPLTEALERMDAGNLPRGAIVFTIDDGFRSVASLALPELERYGYPATIYVTTYYMERRNPVFRLAVQYLFWKTSRERMPTDAFPQMGGTGACDLRTSASRHAAMSRWVTLGEQLPSELEREELARRLGDVLGVDYDWIRETGIVSILEPERVRELAARWDVQLHTHRHRFPQDDVAAARREIRDNRAALRPLVGRDPVHFCYPSGEWAPSQWMLLDELGIRSSATCDPGLNDRRTERHALRRFLDGEHIHPLEFEAELYRFGEMVRRLIRPWRPRMRERPGADGERGTAHPPGSPRP